MASTQNATNIIGNTFLDRYVLTLDWYRNEATFSPIEGYDRETTLYSFGFGYIIDEDRLRVSFLYENSPAFNADLRIGDQILKVNGKDVSIVSLEDYCGILQNGLYDTRMNELDLVVLQDGQKRHLRLEETDLLGYSVEENE